LFSNIDVFELPRVAIPGIQPSEMGEIVTAFLLVIPAFFVDRAVARQRAHEVQLQAEQSQVLRVTMRTVQDTSRTTCTSSPCQSRVAFSL
jgi:hypothetical protein